MSTPTPTPLGLEGVIAVANNKGGCGKTSVCANLAGLTAAAGIRTLVVDFDTYVQPSAQLGRDAEVRLLVEDVQRAAVRWTTTLLP